MNGPQGEALHHPKHRGEIQPRLVNLIAGLSRRQVEEAVELLLDYIDSKATTAPSAVANDGGLLSEIRRGLAAYHFALDTRQHGSVASNALVSEIESILATPWNPGHEAKKRGITP